MKLIIGLGNPGEEYAGTRHNVGFRVVEAVAGEADAEFDDHAGEALIAEGGALRDRRVVLAKPLSYVNRSGDAAHKLLRRYDLEPADLLVVVDDLNLPVAKLRLRPGGSSGGHNGTQHIIDRLGTGQFPRLRFGIGGDFPKGTQAEYVLSPFFAEEQSDVERSVRRSVEAVAAFVDEGIEAAMNRFN